jgi:hypothetical protein
VKVIQVSKYSVNFMKQYIWLSVSVAILGWVSMFENWRHLVSRAIMMNRLRGTNSSLASIWESLSYRQKAKLINLWIIISSLGNICQIFEGFLAFADSTNFQNSHDLLVGLSCFCSWIYILRYLNHDSKAYTLINTLKRSISTLFPYVIGIIPIFMAYVFFGISCFWKNRYFSNILDSMILNFCIMNGDSIYDTFKSVAGQYQIAGMLYMYSCLVFYIW